MAEECIRGGRRAAAGHARVGVAKRTRAALPLPVRLKLGCLEGQAEVAHGRLRVLTDRARAAADERQRLEAPSRGVARAAPDVASRPMGAGSERRPAGRTWVPAIDDNLHGLERDLEQTTADLERLTPSATRHSALAGREPGGRAGCRDHLGVPRD